MRTIGIIAEYNPFHLGHLYQINKAKEMYPDSIIIVVTPSCFTERGEISIINKWNKARICLENNIDLIVELPFLYSTQSADIFAKGSITILNMLGIDTLIFGTETNDINLLKEIAQMQLNDKHYNNIVKKYLDTGTNYPTALSKAIKDIINIEINKPNDLLALSYIKQVMLINNNINLVNIKRTNDYHSKSIDSNIVNASLIREHLNNGMDIKRFIPNYDCNYIYKNITIENFYSLLKYQIINNIDNLNKYLTVDEGIENRIKKFIYKSNTWNELVNNIKTKRYTYNKINRMLIFILINVTKDSINNYDINYIRVLGFNSNGKKHLNKIKKNLNVPLVTNYKSNISNLFDLEYKVNSIYSLIVDNNLINDEVSHKPIMY